MATNWVAPPRYLCRKRIVMNLIKELNFSNFLEIGIGAGDLIISLAKKGYTGAGIDLNNNAILECKNKLKMIGLNNSIVLQNINLLDMEITQKINIVFALEVLEHIKDDEEALKKINNFLIKNGTLILSTPAHKRFWGRRDVRAGHVRRYERDELFFKLHNSGFEVVKILSYGYPFFNVVRPLRNLLFSKDNNKNMLEKTRESAFEKTIPDIGIKFIEQKILPIQYRFDDLLMHNDLGTGYIVISKKM